MEAPERPASLNGNITVVTRLLMALHGGMTQTDLADQLGMDKAVISRSLRGARPWKIEDVEAMAKLFDVSPGRFFDEPEALIRSRCFPDGFTTLSELVAA